MQGESWKLICEVNVVDDYQDVDHIQSYKCKLVPVPIEKYGDFR